MTVTSLVKNICESMSVAASDGTNPSPFPDTSNKITLLVLLRCNSDVSFPTLGYLNEKIFLSLGDWGGRGPRGPPSKYAHASAPLIQYRLRTVKSVRKE